MNDKKVISNCQSLQMVRFRNFEMKIYVGMKVEEFTVSFSFNSCSNKGDTMLRRSNRFEIIIRSFKCEP